MACCAFLRRSTSPGANTDLGSGDAAATSNPIADTIVRPGGAAGGSKVGSEAAAAAAGYTGFADLTLGKELGRGQFGVVLLGTTKVRFVSAALFSFGRVGGFVRVRDGFARRGGVATRNHASAPPHVHSPPQPPLHRAEAESSVILPRRWSALSA